MKDRCFNNFSDCANSFEAPNFTVKLGNNLILIRFMLPETSRWKNDKFSLASWKFLYSYPMMVISNKATSLRESPKHSAGKSIKFRHLPPVLLLYVTVTDFLINALLWLCEGHAEMSSI